MSQERQKFIYMPTRIHTIWPPKRLLNISLILGWVEELIYEERNALRTELAILTDPNRWPERRTINDYLGKGKIITSRGKSLAGYKDVPRSFHKMKSSMRWYIRYQFFDYLSHLSESLSDPQIVEDIGIEILEEDFKYQAGKFAEQLYELDCQHLDCFVDEFAKRRKSKSKRHSLGVLPIGWVDTYWNNAVAAEDKRPLYKQERFLDLLATLILVAPRPCEFSRNGSRAEHEIISQVVQDRAKIMAGDGVLIELKNEQLVFTLAGRKLAANKGQPWRQIHVSVGDSQSEYLRDKILANNRRPLVVRLDSPERLTRWLRELSQQCFPTITSDNHVTCYTFRHLISSQMKAAGYSGESIAMALGQQSDVTQQYYGRARLSKKRSSSIKLVDAPIQVRLCKKTSLNRLRKAQRKDVKKT